MHRRLLPDFLNSLFSSPLSPYLQSTHTPAEQGQGCTEVCGIRPFIAPDAIHFLCCLYHLLVYLWLCHMYKLPSLYRSIQYCRCSNVSGSSVYVLSFFRPCNARLPLFTICTRQAQSFRVTLPLVPRMLQREESFATKILKASSKSRSRLTPIVTPQ